MDGKEPTQQTQPAEGEPIEIPVPTREAIDDAIAKVSRPVPPKPAKKHRKGKPIDDSAARDRARNRSGEGV